MQKILFLTITTCVLVFLLFFSTLPLQAQAGAVSPGQNPDPFLPVYFYTLSAISALIIFYKRLKQLS